MAEAAVTVGELAESIRRVVEEHGDAPLYMWWTNGVSNPPMPWVEQAREIRGVCCLCFGEQPEEEVTPPPRVMASEVVLQMQDMPPGLLVYYHW